MKRLKLFTLLFFCLMISVAVAADVFSPTWGTVYNLGGYPWGSMRTAFISNADMQKYGLDLDTMNISINTPAGVMTPQNYENFGYGWRITFRVFSPFNPMAPSLSFDSSQLSLNIHMPDGSLIGPIPWGGSWSMVTDYGTMIFDSSGLGGLSNNLLDLMLGFVGVGLLFLAWKNIKRSMLHTVPHNGRYFRGRKK